MNEKNKSELVKPLSDILEEYMTPSNYDYIIKIVINDEVYDIVSLRAKSGKVILSPGRAGRLLPTEVGLFLKLLKSYGIYSPKQITSMEVENSVKIFGYVTYISISYRYHEIYLTFSKYR